jgi:hypothetical protein
MPHSNTSNLAGAIALAACPLTVQAFVSSGSGVNALEKLASLRGAGSVPLAAVDQKENVANGVASTSIGIMAFAGGAAIAGQRGRRSQIAKRAEAEKPKPVFDPANEIGVTQPFGFFDPAGFCPKGDEAGFRNLRAAEIKHGRVAMMAAVGGVVQHYVVFPGFESVPRCMGAVSTMPGTVGFAVLFAVAGFLELVAWPQADDKEPGNFGDPVGLNMYNEDMRNKEINNGRMAMFASLGIISANLVTGKDAIEQFGL